MKLSVVIPVYNEEENLPELYKRLDTVLSGLPHSSEIIFVDDASSDTTPDILKKFATEDARVRALVLSRNFGHQIALTAGLESAEGEMVVSMDGDLQDQPEVIPVLIEKFNQGFDIVYAKRRTRKDTVFKKITAFTFYRVLNWLSDVSIPADVGDFRLTSRQVKDELMRCREHAPFLRGLVSWMGFRQATVEFDRDKRFAGAPKYSLKKLIQLAVDGAMSFTIKPLLAILGVGSVLFLVGFIGSIVSLFRFSMSLELVIAVLFLLCGVVLIAIGIIGGYIARITSAAYNRPRYIIREKINI